MPLRRAFREHSVETSFERGWSELENGALIEIAESTGFDALVTTDKNLKHQQNPAVRRRLAILVLWTTSWPEISPHASSIALTAAALQPGEFREFKRPE